MHPTYNITHVSSITCIILEEVEGSYSWNFSRLGSERKQKEVGELLVKNNIDVVAGQEYWEKRTLE